MSRYIQALRSENYLLFLQWPHTIMQSSKLSSQDADSILSSLISEWLNNGFCDEDAKKVAALYAFSELKSQPLQGVLAYALTTISAATIQCLISLHKNEGNQQTIAAEQQAIFDNWVKTVGPAEFASLSNKILPIALKRYKLEEYSDELTSAEMENDSFKSARLSIVERFLSYMNEQTELTAQVQLEINLYVSKIRSMHPAEFELKYLDYFTDKQSTDLVSQTMSKVTDFFYSFAANSGCCREPLQDKKDALKN